MYDNRFTSPLYNYSHPSDTFPRPGETFDILGSAPSLEIDSFCMLNRHQSFTAIPPNRGANRQSPRVLTMTPSRPASPTSFEADRECSDDGSSSPCSFTGEECPDLCGGPKNSCRSWTPPASPFYYTDAAGIFLLDDRQNFEERQKIELEHTLRDLDAKLQRLRSTLSPPRFLSQLNELKYSTPSPPSESVLGPSERFPPPTEGLAGHSCITTTSPKPYPCGYDGTLRRCKFCLTKDASANPSHHTMNSLVNGESRTTDLGKLIHTSLKHVQSTNSPPRYLANVSEIEARPPLKEPIIVPNPHEELRDEISLVKHASPQLHFGNTAYPTPLPSSPETKPSRKRGRDEGSQESSGRKRRREEDEHWISKLYYDQS